MKVLAVSLLRLGDILMLAPVLKSIKAQNSKAVLHVLINKQFRFVESLLPWVDKFIYLDRSELQKGIGESDRNIFEPLDRLDSTISYLNREKYSNLINLSHSKFSGYICGLIEADDKNGLTIGDNNTVSFGNRWYSYLNEQVAGGNSVTAHMLDVHSYGSGLPFKPHDFDFQMSSKGNDEADLILREANNFICIQPLTSDVKKNWGFRKYAESLLLFKAMNPNIEIYALGAPNEKEELLKFQEVCKELGVEVILAICSLDGALAILNRTRLLLTGDTSIKHLACGTDCKIIELAIGSSDYSKTGVYKSNSYIVSSQEACAPCVHSEKCNQPSHLCSESIPVDGVGALMNHVLNSNLREIKIIAKEYSDSMRVLKTYFCYSGFWQVRDLAQNFNSESLESVVNLSSWKLLNRGEHLKLIGEYGSEAVKLKAAIKQVFPETVDKIRNRFFTDFENSVVQNGENLTKIKDILQAMVKNKKEKPKGLQEHYGILKEEFSPKLAQELLEFLEGYSGDPATNFMKLRKYSEIMASAFHRNQIQLKLIRTMMNQRMDEL